MIATGASAWRAREVDARADDQDAMDRAGRDVLELRKQLLRHHADLRREPGERRRLQEPVEEVGPRRLRVRLERGLLPVEEEVDVGEGARDVGGGGVRRIAAVASSQLRSRKDSS
jgi:hypothetical protein